jgi:hypothetical protein
MRPEWMSYEAIKQGLTDSRRRSRASNLIMDLMDRFKSLGIRHVSSRPTFNSIFSKTHQLAYDNGRLRSGRRLDTDLLEDLEIVEDGFARARPDQRVIDNFFWFLEDSPSRRMYGSAMLTARRSKDYSGHQ